MEGETGPAGKGEGDHGDSPSSKSNSSEILAFCVEEGDETRGNVPIAAKVKVLDGVHGEVLKSIESKTRCKEVQADERPVDVLRSFKAGIVCIRNHLIKMWAKPKTEVNPVNKQTEHGG